VCLGLGPDVGSAALSARRNGSALLHAQCVGMDEACVVADLVLLFPLLHSQHALACAYLRKREQERARARERERERERESETRTPRHAKHVEHTSSSAITAAPMSSAAASHNLGETRGAREGQGKRWREDGGE